MDLTTQTQIGSATLTSINLGTGLVKVPRILSIIEKTLLMSQRVRKINRMKTEYGAHAVFFYYKKGWF